MVGGANGRRTASAKGRKTVEKGGRLVPVPAPTHRLLEVEGIARENPKRPRNVNLGHAKVWKIDIPFNYLFSKMIKSQNWLIISPS